MFIKLVFSFFMKRNFCKSSTEYIICAQKERMKVKVYSCQGNFLYCFAVAKYMKYLISLFIFNAPPVRVTSELFSIICSLRVIFEGVKVGFLKKRYVHTFLASSKWLIKHPVWYLKDN